jgi:hypothetical protein
MPQKDSFPEFPWGVFNDQAKQNLTPKKIRSEASELSGSSYPVPCATAIHELTCNVARLGNEGCACGRTIGAHFTYPAENCVVVAEGELCHDGAFHVRALGFPPAEARSDLPMASQVSLCGCCLCACWCVYVCVYVCACVCVL